MWRSELVALVVALAACGKPHAPSAPALRAEPARPAADAFPDNPLLVHVPADTPYALASFRPIPPAYFAKLSAFARSSLARAEAKGGPGAELVRALGDEIGAFDLQHLEQLGFTAKARLVVYGLGVYPVARLELGDGDRVFALAQRVARRVKLELPAPTERDGHRYWTFTKAKDTLVLVLDRRELVVAVVDADHVAEQLPYVLGDRKPAVAASSALFRELARRDHFSAYGLGFIDTARAVAAGFAAAGTRPSDTCRAALASVTAAVPRIGVGYDSVNPAKFSFGAVVELAPELQALASTLGARIPGFERMSQRPPVIGVAVAVDFARAHALVPRLGGAVRELGTACDVGKLTAAGDRIDELAANPLPPFLAGLTGGVVVIDDVEVTDGKLEKLDGYMVVHLADAAKLVEVIARAMPGLPLAADGKARALPSFLRVSGHVAAGGGSIAAATGTDSSGRAEALLADPLVPAPLAVFTYDYARFRELMSLVSPDKETDEDLEAIGVATIRIGVDARGIYAWMSASLQ